MKWLLNVKFNIFLIVATYLCGLWMFFYWCEYGTSKYIYVGIFNMVTATIIALGLYAREGAKFDAREGDR
jgi:hypothetical protein